MILAASLYLFRPVAHRSILSFRLLFTGVEQGTYPNGERFSPSDILSTSVLEKVYTRNELARFIKFDDFKNSLVIAANNPALNRLQREYQDRLAARALSAIERQKLENDFQEKAAALKNAEFTLIAGLDSRFERWPPTLIAKVLTDTINIWLEQFRAQGVFRFDLNIFSENILPVNSTDEDYLVFVDRVRLSIGRIRSNIDDLLKIPGAGLMRAGPSNTSLGELRAKLDDALKYRIGTIDSCIIQYGFYRNRDLAEAYLRDQMFRLQLATDELKAQARTIEAVQSSYAATRAGASSTRAGVAESQNTTGIGNGPMITQLSDTFIDRVMELSERSSEVAFRQNLANRVIAIENKAAEIATERKLYERQLEALAGQPPMSVNSAATKQWMESQLAGLLVELKTALADLQVFHLELSQRNLEPATAYDLMGPVQQVTISTLSTGKIAVSASVLGMAIWGTGLLIVTVRGLRSGEHPTALVGVKNERVDFLTNDPADLAAHRLKVHPPMGEVRSDIRT